MVQTLFMTTVETFYKYMNVTRENGYIFADFLILILLHDRIVEFWYNNFRLYQYNRNTCVSLQT